MKAEVELEKLSKGQIIALIQSGALRLREPVEQPQIEVEVQRVVPRRKKRRKEVRARKKQATQVVIQQRLDKIRKRLAKGRTLTTADLRKMGLGGDVVHLIKVHLQPCRWAKVTGGGSKGKPYLIEPTSRTVGKGFEPRKKRKVTAKRKRKKGAYFQFRGEKIKHYMKQGIHYLEACKLANKDWKEKKGGKPPIPPKPEKQFPKFESVKTEFIPILKTVLKRCIKQKKYIDYRGVNYALDIRTEANYRRFIDDILANSKQIKTYFGVESGRFRYDGLKLVFI